MNNTPEFSRQSIVKRFDDASTSLRVADKMLGPLLGQHTIGDKVLLILAKLPGMADLVYGGPLARARAELKTATRDIHYGVEEISAEALPKVLKQKQINSSLTEIATEEDWAEKYALAKKLEEMLLSEAERDVALESTEISDRFVQLLEPADDPEFQKKDFELIIAQAQKTLALLDPVITVAKLDVLSGKVMEKSLIRALQLLLDAGPTLDAMTRTNSSVKNALSLGNDTSKLIVETLKDALATVDMIQERVNSGILFSDLKDQAELEEISEKAKKILGEPQAELPQLAQSHTSQ